MNEVRKIRYAFGDYDRMTIGGAAYRYVGFKHDKHEFQLVADNVLDEYYIGYTDEEIHQLVLRGNFRHEEAYFSKALTELRMRQDHTCFADLTEEDVRTIFWKREWCVRFNRAHGGRDGFPFALKKTPDDYDTFIETVKDEMFRWYFKQYGAHRRPGRPAWVRQPDGSKRRERKLFDYPSPTALRNWLRDYKAADQRVEAFIPAYANCGNRQQLHPEVELIVAQRTKDYGSLQRPTRGDIYEDIEVALRKLNAKRHPHQKKLSVSVTTVNRRIAKLNPFMVEAARLGVDAALRNYAPAGRGLEIEDFLDRVEIDDWTVDLFSILCSLDDWQKLNRKQRRAIPRIRATITLAIDCATRCIVGLYISEAAPTTAGAKAAVRSIVSDKDALAKYAGADSDWPMHGRPAVVVSDGGPVFKSEFDQVVARVSSGKILPDHDPRMRGYIEAVNETMKGFCRLFTGQSFANVVERGDYDGEAMASLDFEHFRKAFIQYVVDKYHHTEHSGLGGITPYGMWDILTGGRRQIPMNALQQLAVFGLSHNGVTVDKHGVLVLNVSYWSDELGMLFTILGRKQTVDLRIDPNDIGKVLLMVPKEYRDELRQKCIQEGIATDDSLNGIFIVVPSTDTSLWGKSLVEKSLDDAELWAAAKAAKEKSDPFRLNAHESLSRLARRNASAFGVQDHLLSQEAWDHLRNAFRQKTRAATPMPRVDRSEDDDIGEQFGTMVAPGRATGRKRASVPRETPIDAGGQGSPAAAQTVAEEPEFTLKIPNVNEIGLDEADE